jgi:hypothetical protein
MYIDHKNKCLGGDVHLVLRASDNQPDPDRDGSAAAAVRFAFKTSNAPSAPFRSSRRTEPTREPLAGR